eukprot:CAMPEP_0197603530 /NCGR_PEP_ID=MMETSP1326-20131121/39417_1 /TAXON_ID=1155430 /ORGANISM="Genus nov. species nov., Strain RCC2288" /LENGTH=57 /DNA_ID=CAMNT_0043171053 /DNA_START=126 /DNA_END=296 /DNA_ORIENTATION=+
MRSTPFSSAHALDTVYLPSPNATLAILPVIMPASSTSITDEMTSLSSVSQLNSLAAA